MGSPDQNFDCGAFTNTTTNFEEEEVEKKKEIFDIILFEDPPAYVEKLPEDASDDEEKTDKEEDKKPDHFDVSAIHFEDTGPPWKELSTGKKTLRVLSVIVGVCCALGLLYIFICSLDVLQAAFQLLAGRIAGDALSSNQVLNNPMAGLVMGVLATVLLQSSSTSTSIIVTLVGSNVLTAGQAVYIVMGANIGTSVTNTIVALTQSMDKDNFRRSFAGATVHDMFNWLTVLILLPLEVGSHYLMYLTGAIVDTIPTNNRSVSDEPQFLKVITDPLTGRIIKIDKNVMTAVAEGTDRAKYPLCKYYCDMVYDNFNHTWPIGEQNETFIEKIRDMPWTIDIDVQNDTSSTILAWKDLNNQSSLCSHHFTGCGVDGTWCSLSDQAVGGILFACSLIVLLAAVITMVKILNIILKGPMAKAIQVGINASLPGKAKFLTGYLAILMGAGITMLVQSSSVFTSTMTPLVGLGLISVDRMYPLTLGSNIGTCLTGIMAALTADASAIKNTMQVALAHLFFNISGIILFFPVPFLRRLPLRAAKFMGNTTAKYRWFAVAYVICVFFLIPGAIFALSMAGWEAMVGVFVPIGAVVISIVVIKCMQHYCPQKMHPCMRNWKWLPKPLRSLEPCNSVVLKCCYNEKCVNCRKKCCGDDSDSEEDPLNLEEASSSGSTIYSIECEKEPIPADDEVTYGQSNPAFENDNVVLPSHHTESTAL